MPLTIGIPAYKVDSNFGCGLTHLEFISQYGNPRIILPWEENVPVDALYLPGGLDVNPSSYGEIPGFKTSNTDVFKQFFFEKRLQSYIDRGVRIIGVCAGFQYLACLFGYKLIQNLKWHPQSRDRWESGHSVQIVGRELPNTADGEKKKLKVNSHHHQGIIFDPENPNLEMLAYYDDIDGRLVEAFRHRTLPIVAFQYHPKFFGAC